MYALKNGFFIELCAKFDKNVEGVMRLRILEEELITHFTDLRKQYCAFDELEKEFSHYCFLNLNRRLY